MTPEERARRTALWRRYIVRGEELATVIADLATEFDVDEATFHQDLDDIDGWLPHLEVTREVSGFSMLAELRENRQQLHRLADEARDADDLTQERKVREEINHSLNLERRLRTDDISTSPTFDDEDFEKMLGSY